MATTMTPMMMYSCYCLEFMVYQYNSTPLRWVLGILTQVQVLLNRKIVGMLFGIPPESREHPPNAAAIGAIFIAKHGDQSAFFKTCPQQKIRGSAEIESQKRLGHGGLKPDDQKRKNVQRMAHQTVDTAGL